FPTRRSSDLRLLAAGRRPGGAAGRARRPVGEEAPLGMSTTAAATPAEVGGGGRSRSPRPAAAAARLAPWFLGAALGAALAALPLFRPGPNLVRLLFVT